ncbi:hypothetical protein C8J57DRAFT_1224267 [Mycena rebaudengoi]|nr:hypothetical protein C8J57DRAFT_1224267 [Mycena rebaudengoi]
MYLQHILSANCRRICGWNQTWETTRCAYYDVFATRRTAADKNIQVPPLPPTTLRLSACAPERAPLRFFGPKCSRCSVTTLRRHVWIVSPRAQFLSGLILFTDKINSPHSGRTPDDLLCMLLSPFKFKKKLISIN